MGEEFTLNIMDQVLLYYKGEKRVSPLKLIQMEQESYEFLIISWGKSAQLHWLQKKGDPLTSKKLYWFTEVKGLIFFGAAPISTQSSLGRTVSTCSSFGEKHVTTLKSTTASSKGRTDGKQGPQTKI